MIAAATCLMALAAVPAGATPVRGDFAAAPCTGESEAALRYEPGRRVVRAVRDIAEGETIAAPPASFLPDVRAGDTLFLVARVGTATVERQVVAAQPGRWGGTIFVRTPDWHLISAPMTRADR
jgi:hypothetical protein